MDSTLIIIGGLLLGCFISLSWFAGSDAPYVPTKMTRIKKLLKQAGLKKGMEFWELGSGDGRVVIEAARMGTRAYGVEQSWIRILYSRWKAKKNNLPNAKFIHGNIFKRDFSSADYIFIFLLPNGVAKLETLLKKRLKKGAVVITQTFHFKNWKPVKKILVTEKDQPNTLLGKDKYEGDFHIYHT